jgi:hypothetical protein
MINAEIEYSDANKSYKSRKFEADKINIHNQTEAAQINMLNGLGGGLNSLANGAAGLRAADEKAAASHLKNEADRAEFQKNFMQNMAQQRFDSFQKAVQSIDKSVQAMTNIEQSNAGQISSSNRA